MGKKYLDTKQNTIEASILDVWAKSSEEQKAIRNAAKMIAQEQLSKIRGNTPADQGRRAAVEDDIERAKKKGDKKEVARLEEDEIADEAYRPSSLRDVQFPTKGVKKGTRKDLMRLEKELKDAKKKKDKAKEAALQAELELLMKSGAGKKIGPSWMHKEEIELEEGWFKDLVDKKRAGAKAASKKSDTGKPPVPKHKPEKPKPSITSAIKDIYGRLYNGDFLGMTAYLNTLNEDQSSDQIAVVIGDINETELTLINPENLDQTMKINLENLQVDINEDGELEFYEAVDPKTIPVWNPRKGGGRTGQKPPLK